MHKKFFQIGFNKCGTSSIFHFFKGNEIPCIHWDGGNLAKRIQSNIQNGEFVLCGLEQYRAFTDMEFVTSNEIINGYEYFLEILQQVEHSQFILNTRDRDNWIKSRLAQQVPGEASYAEAYRSYYGFDDIPEVIEFWEKDWDEHHAAVQALIPANRLLVFNIEKDPPEHLCNFVGLDTSAARHYTLKNSTAKRK